MNKLVLVISGQIVRENSANLMNFWRGFINIQNAIYDIDELKIVAHSWNSEYDELVKNVYNVDIIESEKQESFVNEYMPLLKPMDRFENGLKRFKSTWKRVSYQAILGNAKSRTKAITLLQKLNLDENDKILALRWDNGCSGSKEVNQIIYDESLEGNYLYISYYSEVDEGYADMWFVAPYKIAINFEKYEKYVLECFSGENSFFDNFTKNGWFLALEKNNKLFLINQYKKALLKKVLNKFPFPLIQKIVPKLSNKIIGLQQKIKNLIDIPQITGENSLFFGSKTNVKFTNYQALNNHAMLKSFIFENKIREKTRFLDIKDFNKINDGQMINPVDFAYIIYSHSSFADCWDMAIGQAKECLPSNCKKIYLVSDNSQESIEAFAKFEKDEQIGLLTYENNQKYTNRLIKVMNEVNEKFDFVYFVHEDMPLTNKVDKVYLNTLLHYMNNSNEFYIKLVDTNYVDEKQDHDSFPNLVRNFGGYSFSVQVSLLKPDYIVSFLANFNEDIYGLEQMSIKSNFIFSAVKGNKKIGKYLLSNDYFPHISTAISKGKWCTDEWSDDIKYLAEKYSIDLSIRGEI